MQVGELVSPSSSICKRTHGHTSDSGRTPTSLRALKIVISMSNSTVSVLSSPCSFSHFSVAATHLEILDARAAIGMRDNVEDEHVQTA